MIQVFAKGPKGHAALTNHGDDGKVHISAYRKQGAQVVHIGDYEISIEDLRTVLGEDTPREVR